MFDKDFAKGGAILVICFGIGNLINFFFHFGMARLLSVADYGILATLLSFIYLLALCSESIQTVISKNITENKNSAREILQHSMKKMIYPSVLLFLVYLAVSIPLAALLRINYALFFLNGLIIFGSFYMPINRGLLQGKKRFLPLGENMIVEAAAKLGISLLLVGIGFAVYGAIIGGLFGAGIAYAISFIHLKPLFTSKDKTFKKNIKYGYGGQSFLIVLAIMIFFSVDVVVARIVFEPDIVGAYAIASTIAKTIFFAAMPISKAMFSFTAEKSSFNKSKRIFLNALAIISAGILIALVLFYIFPELWVRIFSGKYLPLAASLLFILGIAYSLITITNIVLLYRISIGKVRYVWLIMLMPVIEILLFFLFSKNITQFAFSLVASSALFLWVSLTNNNSR